MLCELFHIVSWLFKIFHFVLVYLVLSGFIWFYLVLFYLVLSGLQSYKIEDIIRTVFLPTMEGSINFCHTIQVEKLPVLKRIIIVGKPGLMICLHGKGQLLNNDMTACKSNVNSYNTRLSTNELLVFFEK